MTIHDELFIYGCSKGDIKDFHYVHVINNTIMHENLHQLEKEVNMLSLYHDADVSICGKIVYLHINYRKGSYGIFIPDLFYRVSASNNGKFIYMVEE